MKKRSLTDFKSITWPKMPAMSKGLKLAAAVLGASVLSHMAVVHIPALTSSPLEEYMKDNNVPLGLVDGMTTDDIRVYDKNGAVSAHNFAWNQACEKSHLLVKSGLGININDDFKQTYAKNFARVRDGDARIVFDFGAYNHDQIIAQARIDIKDHLHDLLGFDVSDIEIGDAYTDFEYFFMLMHEVSHARYPDFYGSVTSEKEDSKNEKVLRGEIAADYGAIQALEGIGHDISDYVIARRAVSSVSIVSTHQTAYYLDALVAGDDVLPDVVGHDLDQELFKKMVSVYKGQYDQTLSDKEIMYLSTLDFLDSEDLENLASPRTYRMAELYVEGIEFFIPSRAKELRIIRDNFHNGFCKARPLIL